MRYMKRVYNGQALNNFLYNFMFYHGPLLFRVYSSV
jgi:hypothetical protein